MSTNYYTLDGKHIGKLVAQKEGRTFIWAMRPQDFLGRMRTNNYSGAIATDGGDGRVFVTTMSRTLEASEWDLSMVGQHFS